ncbi:hypothetical protein ACQJBY_032376 [Aegilops geniculata]
MPAMAAAQEEPLGLVKPAPLPPPPSIFLDQPSMINGDSQSQQPQDDLALAYISRMLMEEDIIDKFFYQHPEHPTLLQAEQPFAEILSASGITTAGAHGSSALLPSQGNNTGIMASGFLSSEVLSPALILNGTVTAEEHSSGVTMGDLSSMAFFKGMEEANSFLPTVNVMVDARGRKKRSGMDGETEACMGRSSKQIAVRVLAHGDSAEEDTALELDLLILNGYNMHSNETMKERGDEAAYQSICRKAPCVRHSARQKVVADLETLLIRCAEAVATNDRSNAGDLLKKIKQHSLPTGDARQRLAYYFAEGLEARLAGTGRQMYHSITMANHTSTVELFKSYHLCIVACCFLKVSLNFSNKNIYNAVAGRKKLHIVHYGVNDGFQWPDLLRWLADREGGPPEVRITGIISPQPGPCPAKQAKETKRRLSYCARQFGVPFKFHAIIAKLEAVHAEDLDIDPDEVLVVNNMFHFRTLMDESLTFDMENPRDLVLNTIRKMKPSMLIHAAVNGAYSSAFFMTRFRQALNNFTAQFDMMETTMMQNKDKRLLVERHIFARSVMNIIACEGPDRVERPQNYKEWHARNQRAGLRQLSLDPDIVKMLKDQVKKQYHKHFMIDEDQRWLLLGWKGRVLYALSTWVAADASGSQLE